MPPFLHRFISFGPRRQRANQNFLYHTSASPFGSLPSNVVSFHIRFLNVFSLWMKSFSSRRGLHTSLLFFICLLRFPHLMHRQLLAAARLRAMLFPSPFLSRLHVATPREPPSLFYWTVLTMSCAISPPSIIDPSFASSSAFSLFSETQISKKRHVLLLLLGALRFDLLDLQ